MNVQDVFVGAVACVLGGGAVGAAVFNWEWFYQLKKAQWLEARCGRLGARWTFASLGVFLIVLGITVASGVRWGLGLGLGQAPKTSTSFQALS